MNKLSNIINEFLLVEGLGESEYIKIYSIGRRGLTTLHKEVLPNSVTKIVPVNSDNTVDFPTEAYKVTRVGVLNKQGTEVKALTRNSTIGTLNPEICVSCRNDHSHCECENGFVRNSRTSPLGIGSWTNIGEYNISGRKILLHPNCNYCEIVIEYSTVLEKDGDICVDPLVEEALLAYLRYHVFRGKRSVGTYEKRDMKREYEVEKRKLKLMRNSLSRQELWQGALSRTKEGL